MAQKVNPSKQHKEIRDARKVCANFSKKMHYTKEEFDMFKNAHDLLEHLNYKKVKEFPLEVISHAKNYVAYFIEKNLFSMSIEQYAEYTACLGLLERLRNERPL